MITYADKEKDEKIVATGAAQRRLCRLKRSLQNTRYGSVLKTAKIIDLIFMPFNIICHKI